MKMKSFLGLAAASVFAVSAAVASPLVTTTLKPGMLHPPMDVTVINSSANTIYINLSDGSELAVYPTNSQHLYSYDPSVYYYPLSLENYVHSNIYSYTVCREAIVIVNNNTIKYDDDLCKP